MTLRTPETANPSFVWTRVPIGQAWEASRRFITVATAVLLRRPRNGAISRRRAAAVVRPFPGAPNHTDNEFPEKQSKEERQKEKRNTVEYRRTQRERESERVRERERQKAMAFSRRVALSCSASLAYRLFFSDSPSVGTFQ